MRTVLLIGLVAAPAVFAQGPPPPPPPPPPAAPIRVLDAGPAWNVERPGTTLYAEQVADLLPETIAGLTVDHVRFSTWLDDRESLVVHYNGADGTWAFSVEVAPPGGRSARSLAEALDRYGTRTLDLKGGRRGEIAGEAPNENRRVRVALANGLVLTLRTLDAAAPPVADAPAFLDTLDAAGVLDALEQTEAIAPAPIPGPLVTDLVFNHLIPRRVGAWREHAFGSGGGLLPSTSRWFRRGGRTVQLTIEVARLSADGPPDARDSTHYETRYRQHRWHLARTARPEGRTSAASGAPIHALDTERACSRFVWALDGRLRLVASAQAQHWDGDCSQAVPDLNDALAALDEAVAPLSVRVLADEGRGRAVQPGRGRHP